MKLSLIIPCYNESKSISLILKRWATVLTRQDVELVIVNNGSTDDTARVLKDLLPQFPSVRQVDVAVNQGYGFGILAGLRQARGEYVGWTHADMQTDLADALKALTIIESMSNPQNVFIKGLRQGRPCSDVFFTVGMALMETMLLGAWFWDINAQPNIFHQSFLKQLEDAPHDFSLDLYAFYCARRSKYRIIRFPVNFPQRVHGHSTWNTGIMAKWKFIKRTVIFSWQLKKRFLKKVSL